MRILMISEDFLPYIGGISHHVAMLSSALSRRGHSVYLLARVPRASKLNLKGLDDVKITLVPTTMFETGRLHGLRHIEFILKGCGGLGHLVRDMRFDIAHWHGLWSDSVLASLSRRLGVKKLVFTNHSSKFLELYSGKLKRSILRAWLTEPDACISPSRELAEKYRAIFKHVRTLYIPNGVDLTAFLNPVDKLQARTKLGLPMEGLVVICPRRLCQKNGVHHLLVAVQHTPKESRPLFVIAGDGPMASLLRDQAKSLGVTSHVRFLGAIPYDQMPFLYAASDIAVFPSLMEATSLAALEALACGLPVVASAVGGLKDILEGSAAGILVPPASPEILAKKVFSLIMDVETRKQMANLARVLARQYSWDEIARQTEDVYKSLKQ